MILENRLKEDITLALKTSFNIDIKPNDILLQKTKQEFEGDFTLVVFPYLKVSGKGPEQTADTLGNFLNENSSLVDRFNVVKGFLNIVVSENSWLQFFDENKNIDNYGYVNNLNNSNPILIEYSSPNTNKPLHLGHVRNNLLGWSVANILEANGHRVIKVNIVNDRGVHICKSMLAYQKFGKEETPESSNIKGDHLVGDYYVAFDKQYKVEVAELIKQGKTKEEAEKNAPLMLEVQEMLRQWEANDPKVKDLWSLMNGWVYKGFAETYKKLGVEFDKIYYESETYITGKKIVLEGLEKGLFFTKPDGSIWIDLKDEGLDEKVLIRADGTSLYITQDIGTSVLRHNDFGFDKMVYIVGNEQDYHFKVLFKVMEKLGYSWSKGLSHLSYGMVELPEGKMKSREGTVVDADDLIYEMIKTARATTEELGKTEDFTEDEKAKLYETIGLGALKYFILKVDPKKKMLFNPKESIDFHGNTGPFIQYTYARIQSILSKADAYESAAINDVKLHQKEKELIRLIYDFPATVAEAGKGLSPAVIANYVYELAKDFNQFYHDCPILKETDEQVQKFRLDLIAMVARIIKRSMNLLGADVPNRM